ncbi:MAG: hypothetical protein Kow0096_08840 [Thiohalomonadaceae bacterium]
MHKLIMLLSASLLWAAVPALADNAERFDGYTVHYNAFNANMLDPRVAQTYQLRRGCNDGVLTIALRRDDGSAVAANVRVTIVTLVGQHSTIAMQEVRDAKSIYYVGGFTIPAEAEPLKFVVRLRAEGAAGEQRFEFSRQMFRC